MKAWDTRESTINGKCEEVRKQNYFYILVKQQFNKWIELINSMLGMFFIGLKKKTQPQNMLSIWGKLNLKKIEKLKIEDYQQVKNEKKPHDKLVEVGKLILLVVRCL